MRIRSLFVAAVVLSAAPAAAQPAQTYRNEQSGYSVEIPAGWARVPDEALDVMRATLEQGEYDVGYRAGKGAWPAPPIFGIGRLDVGREISRDEFIEAFAGPAARENLQAGVDESPAAAAGGEVGAPRWDAENGIVWMRLALESDGTSPAFGITAIKRHPGNRSILFFIYYGARGEDEARVRADVLSIARSLRAD